MPPKKQDANPAEETVEQAAPKKRKVRVLAENVRDGKKVRVLTDDVRVWKETEKGEDA